MKKLLLPLIVAVVILTGCDNTEPEATAPSTEQSAPAEPTEPDLTEEQVDDVFITVLSDQDERFAHPEIRSQVIELAHETCAAFDRGASFEDVALVIFDNMSAVPGFTAETTGYLIGAGTAAYCPEHIDLIEDSSGA